MEDSKLKVVILFGGQSGEHQVSLSSAKSVLQAIDHTRYIVLTIGISQAGHWYWGVLPDDLLNSDFPISGVAPLVTLVHDPNDPHFITLDGTPLPDNGQFDLIFPILHGPNGEDGTLQGLLELANVPYVGSGVLGSSLGMDKDRMKAAFAHAGLPQANYLTFHRSEFRNSSESCIERVEQALRYPCFVKPANLGSSVGISKAHNPNELLEALKFACLFDRKIVVEQNIFGREIEISVLGNDFPEASLPGEIVPANEFYDYVAKYEDTGSRLIIPALLPETLTNQLRKMAIQAFLAVEASGLSRVDFFVTANNEPLINEINTMPGFTQISMYPKLWEATGINNTELIDRLITLGLERFQDKQERQISHKI
ncbi:MAG: D-alanine--D-alanine ligase [Desulfitobacteriaceae bacterium]